MYSDAFHNLDQVSTIPIIHSRKQTSKNNFMAFENFAILFSIVGPILSLAYLVFIIPLSIEFNSLNNWTQIDQFSINNMVVLINLIYLLLASCVFAVVGLMLGLVHKKITLIILNFLSLAIAFGMFLPNYVMIIGD